MTAGWFVRITAEDGVIPSANRPPAREWRAFLTDNHASVRIRAATVQLVRAGKLSGPGDIDARIQRRSAQDEGD